jgi:hypothetical protein
LNLISRVLCWVQSNEQIAIEKRFEELAAKIGERYESSPLHIVTAFHTVNCLAVLQNNGDDLRFSWCSVSYEPGDIIILPGEKKVGTGRADIRAAAVGGA